MAEDLRTKRGLTADARKRLLELQSDGSQNILFFNTKFGLHFFRAFVVFWIIYLLVTNKHLLWF